MALPETVTLPSGTTLTLKDAPFEVSMRLLKTVARELGSVTTGLKLDVNFGTDPAALARLFASDLPLDVIKNAVCQMVASDALEAVLNECMGRCLYGQVACTKNLFEDRNARKDYILVAWEVIKFNLAPFFDGLSSRSKTNGAGTGSTLK